MRQYNADFKRGFQIFGDNNYYIDKPPERQNDFKNRSEIKYWGDNFRSESIVELFFWPVKLKKGFNGSLIARFNLTNSSIGDHRLVICGHFGSRVARMTRNLDHFFIHTRWGKEVNGQYST